VVTYVQSNLAEVYPILHTAAVPHTTVQMIVWLEIVLVGINTVWNLDIGDFSTNWWHLSLLQN